TRSCTAGCTRRPLPRPRHERSTRGAPGGVHPPPPRTSPAVPSHRERPRLERPSRRKPMSVFEPRELADIHNHLVPGVDDGASTLADSLRHLRLLRAAALTRPTVSPHLAGRSVHEPGAVYLRLERLEHAFTALVAACRALDGVPDFVFGQEILVPD